MGTARYALLVVLVAPIAQAAAQGTWSSLPEPVPDPIEKPAAARWPVTLGKPIATLGRPVSRSRTPSDDTAVVQASHFAPVGGTLAPPTSNGSIGGETYSEFAGGRTAGLRLPAPSTFLSVLPRQDEAEGNPDPATLRGRPTGDFQSLPDPNQFPSAASVSTGAGSTGAAFSETVFQTDRRERSGLYGSVEYLLWWIENENVPPLATTSSRQPVTLADFAQNAAPFPGALDDPATVVLFRGPLDRDAQSGARFTLGSWLPNAPDVGLELSGFFLGERSDRFSASSNQVGLLVRPFFSIDQGQEFFQLVALPGQSTGSLSIEAPSHLWGLEANVRKTQPRCGNDGVRLDCLYGFRYLNFSEGLFITERIQVVQGLPGMNVVPGTGVVVNDSFQTHNQFYGVQIGASATWENASWSLDVIGKLALGVSHQVSKVNGSQVLFPPNAAPIGFQGGLYALSSNIGRHTDNELAVVPEIGVRVGYRVTDNVKLTAGYNFLYWSSVARPGAQIDRVVDVNLVPNAVPIPNPTGLNRPAPQIRGDGFWAQGLTFGLQLNY